MVDVCIPREPETYKIVGRKKKQGFQEKPMFAFFPCFRNFHKLIYSQNWIELQRCHHQISFIPTKQTMPSPILPASMQQNAAAPKLPTCPKTKPTRLDCTCGLIMGITVSKGKISLVFIRSAQIQFGGPIAWTQHRMTGRWKTHLFFTGYYG